MKVRVVLLRDEVEKVLKSYLNKEHSLNNVKEIVFGDGIQFKEVLFILDDAQTQVDHRTRGQYVNDLGL